MTPAMIEELKAVTAVVVEAEKEEKVVDEVDKSGGVEDGENEDQDMVPEKPKEVVKEKEPEPSGRDRGYETRDWKRNGGILICRFHRRTVADLLFPDERWLDWFDAKIALLINRDGVDPRDYGGKDYEEYVSLSPQFITP